MLNEGLSFAATTAIVVDAVVAADGIEPRSEIGIGVEFVQRAEDPQEYFLGQILRLLVASREFIRDSGKHGAGNAGRLPPRPAL